MNREELLTEMDKALNSMHLRRGVSTIFSNDMHLLDLHEKIRNNRATGKTSRMVNEIIDEFFREPMGTPIYVEDHYYEIGNQLAHYRANEMLLRKITDRLTRENPNIEYEVKVRDGNCVLIRKSPTAREMMEEEYEKELTRKLIEVNKHENCSNK